MEDDTDEYSGSDFFKASTRVFDKIYNGKDGVLPYLILFHLMGTLGESFRSKELVGHLFKVDQNESVRLDCFEFVGWYEDKEVSMVSTYEAELFVGSGYKTILLDLQ